MTIEGRPVMDLMPDFSTAPQRVAKRLFLNSGLGYAAQNVGFPGKIATHGMSHTYLLTSRDEIETFAAFFDEMAGKWGDFWLPSWNAELNPVADLAEGETALSITPVGYNAAYLTESDTTRLGRYVWLLKYDGTVFISRVDSCADGDPEVMTLVTPAPSDFVLGSFIVGFLYLVRFVNDALVLDFSGPAEASTTVAMIETMQLIASDDAP